MLRLMFFLFLIVWHLYLKCFDYFSVFFNFKTVNNHSIYDFIIVGSGTAGSTIAYRLSQNTDNKILLIEAGSYAPWFINVPVVGPLLQQSAVDWEYSTVPQKMACKSLKKQKSNWPMGKLVGGTSWFNNLLYVRGIKEDYDNWFRDYNNYNYERDILYYFKKFESTLKLSEEIYSTISDNVLQAAKEMGLNFLKIQATISESGTRWTPSHNLLSYTHPNFQLVTKSVVTKLLIDRSNGIVSGIELMNSYNEMLVIWANKAVILTAGVIGTPKLLQLSGIGPKTVLKKLGIPILFDLPVGNNLQDHVTTGLDLIVLDAPPVNRFDLNTMISPSNLAQYLFYSKGPFRSIGCEMTALLKTNSSKEIPDLQLMVVPTGATVDYGVFFKHIFKITEETWSRYFYKLYNNYTISILPVLLHPKSKGYVHVSSKNPLDKPLINPNYLFEQEDVNTLLKGIEIVQKLVQSESMQKLGAKIVTEKISGCQNYKFNTSEYWTCYIRHLTLTAYHPVGTCKLGHRSDRSTVVDYNFRVHGLSNLYVADASVMPSLPTGNVHAAVGMIAEKVADIVQLSHASLCGVQNVERICSLKSIFFTSL